MGTFFTEYRSDFTPMLIHELHEPIEFTNSFLVWMESKKKLSFEERVSYVCGNMGEYNFINILLIAICGLGHGCHDA